MSLKIRCLFTEFRLISVLFKVISEHCYLHSIVLITFEDSTHVQGYLIRDIHTYSWVLVTR